MEEICFSLYTFPEYIQIDYFKTCSFIYKLVWEQDL